MHLNGDAIIKFTQETIIVEKNIKRYFMRIILIIQ